jgi:hypothetical protein
MAETTGLWAGTETEAAMETEAVTETGAATETGAETATNDMATGTESLPVTMSVLSSASVCRPPMDGAFKWFPTAKLRRCGCHAMKRGRIRRSRRPDLWLGLQVQPPHRDQRRINGRMTCGCPTSKTDSSARHAASVVPTCGRIFNWLVVPAIRELDCQPPNNAEGYS